MSELSSPKQVGTAAREAGRCSRTQGPYRLQSAGTSYGPKSASVPLTQMRWLVATSSCRSAFYFAILSPH